MSLIEDILKAEQRRILRCNALAIPESDNVLNRDKMIGLLLKNTDVANIIDYAELSYKTGPFMHNAVSRIINIYQIEEQVPVVDNFIDSRCENLSSGEFRVYKCELGIDITNSKLDSVNIDVDAIYSILYIFHNQHKQIADMSLLELSLMMGQELIDQSNKMLRAGTITKMVMGNKAVCEALEGGDKLFLEMADDLNKSRVGIKGSVWDRERNIVTYTY